MMRNQLRRATRSNRWLRCALVAACTTLALLGAYLGAGWCVYDELARSRSGHPIENGNSPTGFAITNTGHRSFDTTSYRMPAFESVTITSRAAGIELDSWWVEAPKPATQPAPTILLVHGLRASKAEGGVLLTAGMLHRQGLNVLMIDLRDHGHSTVEDRRTSLGTREYIDCMAAIDWLVDEREIPASRIGLWGSSMGAGTAAIAFGHDTRIQAVVLDSGYLELATIIGEELDRNGFPTLLVPAVVASAALFAGESLLDPAPRDAFENAGARPIFIIHGLADTRVGSHHSRAMLDLARRVGAHATCWLVPGARHNEVKLLHPVEYERRLADFFRSALLPRRDRAGSCAHPRPQATKGR